MDAEFMQQAEEQEKLAQELISKGYPPITAIIMSGDLYTYHRAQRWVRGEFTPKESEMFPNGLTPEEAIRFVGSYYRFNFFTDMWEAGNISDDYLVEHIAHLWAGADPDDTDARFWNIWLAAVEHNGGPFLDRPLPEGDRLIIYRGQETLATPGIAWTLNRDVAKKFALGAGSRSNLRSGWIIEGTISPKNVLAHITNRNEAEIIVDRRNVVITAVDEVQR